MVDHKPESLQEIIERIARNLGIVTEALLNDPAFREVIGAEEFDRVEAALREKESGEQRGAS